MTLYSRVARQESVFTNKSVQPQYACKKVHFKMFFANDKAN